MSLLSGRRGLTKLIDGTLGDKTESPDLVELIGDISEVSDLFKSLSIDSFMRGSSTLRPVSELVDLSTELSSPTTEDCLEQSGNSDKSLDGLIQLPFKMSASELRSVERPSLFSVSGENSKSKL